MGLRKSLAAQRSSESNKKHREVSTSRCRTSRDAPALLVACCRTLSAGSAAARTVNYPYSVRMYPVVVPYNAYLLRLQCLQVIQQIRTTVALLSLNDLLRQQLYAQANNHACLICDFERVKALSHNLFVLHFAFGGKIIFERRPDHDPITGERRSQEDPLFCHPVSKR